ncbi:AlpA family phage regulatory protein [Colwellia sp. PAMC 21821]|uniref:helix-turn-helix transcriptional regulator n=1 Tax=Colwellia sp. PAMC 21821 TaxID=1816219 RepID=UPI0009BFACD6|nr:AlpA family phage regulatory protein [Colwellia sp. PAMC 21821]
MKNMLVIENSPNRLLREEEVLILTGQSRTSLFMLEKAGGFPRRIKLSLNGRSVRWKYQEILNWIDEKCSAREV